MPIIFDPDVFDAGVFNTYYGIPALFKLTVEREFKKIVSGQVVIIHAYIIDLSNPYRRLLFNLDSPPHINVYNPDGSVRVNNGLMINVNLGVYQYRLQTGINLDAIAFDPNVFDVQVIDPLGVYTGFIISTEGNFSIKSVPVELYEVIHG